MLALLALLLPMSDVDVVLARNTSFIRSIRGKSMVVEFTVTIPPIPASGKGRLVADYPRGMRFDLHVGPMDYTFTSSQGSWLEVERGNKLYMEERTHGFAGVPQSRISQAPQVGFPKVLTEPVKGGLIVGAEYTYLGKSDIRGIKVDRLHAKWTTSVSRGEATMAIDSDGRPIRYSWWEERIQEGRRGNDMEFTSYAIGKPVPKSVFNVSIPSGYVPYALPSPFNPFEVGADLKLGKWRNSAGQEVDLDKEIGGKPALLFVTAADCEPSRRAEPLVRELSGLVRVVRISDKAGADAYYSGTTMKALQAPGTPGFYLISADGKLNRTWYGFDAGAQKVLGDDIKAAVSGL